MSVMYFFTNLMGKVGSFLMLVFMVIQLAGSVGTYPLELVGLLCEVPARLGAFHLTPSPPSAVPSAAVRASPDAWLTWRYGWWSSRC